MIAARQPEHLPVNPPFRGIRCRSEFAGWDCCRRLSKKKTVQTIRVVFDVVPATAFLLLHFLLGFVCSNRTDGIADAPHCNGNGKSCSCDHPFSFPRFVSEWKAHQQQERK
jgi:hypothetical protein